MFSRLDLSYIGAVYMVWWKMGHYAVEDLYQDVFAVFARTLCRGIQWTDLRLLLLDHRLVVGLRWSRVRDNKVDMLFYMVVLLVRFGFLLVMLYPMNRRVKVVTLVIGGENEAEVVVISEENEEVLFVF